MGEEEELRLHPPLALFPPFQWEKMTSSDQKPMNSYPMLSESCFPSQVVPGWARMLPGPTQEEVEQGAFYLL